MTSMTTPPPGQALTAETVKLLVKGDLLRCERWNGDMFTAGREYEVVSKDADGDLVLISDEAEAITLGLIGQFTFIRRPTHPCYDEHQPGCDCAVPEEAVARSKPPHLDRLASQSTAPTRGEGDDSPTTQEMQRAEVVSILLQYSFEGGAACDVADEILTAIAPTPPEPVASALADGEGLECKGYAHRRRGEVGWSVSTYGPADYGAFEVEPLVSGPDAHKAAESAAARIAELEARLNASVENALGWQDRATQSEARADRLTKALPDLSSVIGWLASGCDPTHAVTELRIYKARIEEALREPKSGGEG